MWYRCHKHTYRSPASVFEHSSYAAARRCGGTVATTAYLTGKSRRNCWSYCSRTERGVSREGHCPRDRGQKWCCNRRQTARTPAVTAAIPDTAILSTFGKICRLDLLQSLFDDVYMAPA